MANLKLNQVIALEKGAKSTANASFTKTYHTLQKAPLFAGQERTYQRRDDEGEQFPAEPVKLQQRVETVLRDLVPMLSRWYDLVATKDAGNQIATADVVVDDTVVIGNVPVTTLLFLEKQLTDMETVISKVPVLDNAENWSFNQRDGHWVTEPVFTNKTKKVPRTLVKAPATDKHPAQVDVFTEDAVIGTWATVKVSGAIAESDRQKYLEKIQKLKAAVKMAREQANMTEVTDRRISDAMFQYLGW